VQKTAFLARSIVSTGKWIVRRSLRLAARLSARCAAPAGETTVGGTPVGETPAPRCERKSGMTASSGLVPMVLRVLLFIEFSFSFINGSSFAHPSARDAIGGVSVGGVSGPRFPLRRCGGCRYRGRRCGDCGRGNCGIGLAGDFFGQLAIIVGAGA